MRSELTQTLLKFTLISIVISIFIQLINFSINQFQIEELLDLKSYAINFGYAFIIGIVNVIGFKIIYTKYNWYRDVKKLIFIGIIGSVAWSTFAFFLARVLHIVVLEGVSIDVFLKSEFIGTYVFSMLISLVVTLIFHAIYFYKALQESKLREQNFINEQTNAEYDALKNQLDPHFLFNSLNVLSALIDENPEKAQEFTTHLSRIYRYILDHKNKSLVNLDEEINFADRYMNLIKMRFEDSVVYKQKITETKGYKIIPLSLQLLIENAIKHNKISEQEPLCISIEIKNRRIIISNNINKKIIHQSNRNGIGLENIKNRMSKFTDKPVEIMMSDTQFSVEIPLIQQQ